MNETPGHWAHYYVIEKDGVERCYICGKVVA